VLCPGCGLCHDQSTPRCGRTGRGGADHHIGLTVVTGDGDRLQGPTLGILEPKPGRAHRVVARQNTPQNQPLALAQPGHPRRCVQASDQGLGRRAAESHEAHALIGERIPSSVGRGRITNADRDPGCCGQQWVGWGGRAGEIADNRAGLTAHQPVADGARVGAQLKESHAQGAVGLIRSNRRHVGHCAGQHRPVRRYADPEPSCRHDADQDSQGSGRDDRGYEELAPAEPGV